MLKDLFAQQGQVQGMIVAVGDVVAFTQPAAADEDTIRSLGEGPQDVRQVHPPRAHQANQSHICRVLQSGNSSQVSRPVYSPVADKADDPGGEHVSSTHG